MVEATKHLGSAEAIMPEPVLQARKLCKTYQMGEITVTALQDVDLDLYQGELAVLLGASGSGKSTRLGVEPDELLRKVPFFRETTEDDFLILSKKMQRTSVSGREVVIQQGEKGDRLYLIARGVVRISREKDGKSTELTSLFAGDFFGEMALLHDDIRTATVTSVTPCTFYVLDRKDVEEVMEQQPSIRIALQRADQRRRGEQAEAETKTKTKTEKQTGIK